MEQVFISYSREDVAHARRLAEALHRAQITTFMDASARGGTRWSEVIQDELRQAGCVLVLWSRHAVDSFWVCGEAAEAYRLGTLVPARIDDAPPPRLFADVQAEDLLPWFATGNDEPLQRLIDTLRAKLGALPMYGNLEPVAPKAAVTEAHLHLIHSAWRKEVRTPFGVMPYRIHVILYGHDSALDRVESVTYLLPGYPRGHQEQPGGPREELFQLKECANGYSIVQARVAIRDQPPHEKGVITLSRFLNLSEYGPRLDRDFLHRARDPVRSRMKEKMHSLPEAVQIARAHLQSMDRERAIRRLILEGVPLVMAETAVAQASKL